MAVMMGRLYAALREANVPEDKATAAAEEIAAYDNRLAAIESRLAVLTWMVGSTIALVVAVGTPALWLLLRVASKVGAL
jgi:glutathione S-transferase